MYGSYIGILNVYKLPVNGTLDDGQVLFTRTGQQASSSQWLQRELYIRAEAVGFRIAFEAISRSDSYYSQRGDIAIDDLELRESPQGSYGFSCTFEGGLCGWTQSHDDSADWTRRSGQTPTYNTGPAFDHTIGDSSGFYYYFEMDLYSYDDKAVLLSPVLDQRSFQGQSVCCFNFWYSMYGNDVGTLNVYKVPVNGRLSDGEVIFTRNGQQNNAITWLKAALYISAVDTDFRIAFEVIHRSYQYHHHYYYSSATSGDIAIDDVELKTPCVDCTFERDTCGWTQSTEDDTEWMCQQQGRTESTDTGPEFDKTTGGATGHYCYFEASSPRSAGDNAVFLSDVFQYSPELPGLTWFLRFWYNMHGSSIGTLNVYKIPTNGTLSEGEILLTLNGEQTDGTTWLQAEINVTYITSSFRVAIEAVRGSDFQGDIAIDDVTSESLVLPTIINLSDGNGNYSTGNTSYLVEGNDRQFRCEVPNINPGAAFVWTLESRDITPDTTSHVSHDNGLTTSTSFATLSPTWSMHGQSLRCHASNGYNHLGVSISVYLDIKVLPVQSSMALYDAIGVRLGPTADVIHGILHTFSCEALGTRPAASIDWYLNDMLQHTDDPPIEAEDRLVNTTSTWTFAPNWTNHVEVVKCVARIGESHDPSPSVMTTLTVYAYPTSITLSDSTGSYPSTGGTSYLVEGVEHQFTCIVPNIDPGASFTWSIGDEYIVSDTNDHVTGSTGLTTSTSIATVIPMAANHGQLLRCQASNEDGHPGIGISVTLDVKVPPKVSSMSLRDSNGNILETTTEVYQGIPYTLTCRVLSTRPAVTIQLFLEDILQRTIQPPLGGGDGFLNTTGNWTFMPSRADQGEVVKCVASNAETHQPYPSVMVALQVNVLPASVTLSDSTGRYPSSGGIAYLVEGDDRVFTCMVPNIDPEASFNWMVGSQDFTPDYNINVTEANGLTNSTSVATVSPTGSNHGELLLCQASNKDDHLGISVSVTLDVKVPPKVSSMKMSGSSGTRLRTIAEVNQNTPQIFTCEVQATRPAVTIKWFLNDVLQRTVTPSTGESDGLVDTMDSWSFTPSRANHGQEVKCVASTQESRVPYPSVTVTLDVFVLPHTIFLADSTTNFTSTSDVSYLVAGVDYQFMCEVPETHPGASFSWTLGGQELRPDRNIHIAGNQGLTTSTSIATVTASAGNHGETLQCRASNEDSLQGIAVSVTLDVKVPPVASHMSLYDSNGSRLQATVEVDEGTAQNVTCIVQNTRPVVDIYWFLGDDFVSAVSPPITTGDAFVNTSAILEFIPSREDHGKELKCVASTPESQQPLPSVAVILDVSALPTSIVMVDATGTYPSTGGTSYLIEGGNHWYVCDARNTEREATFTWTLGSHEITPDMKSEVNTTDGWTNRTSSVTVLAAGDIHGKTLQCQVSNEDGDPGISTGVMLYVKVPPKSSSMHLYDSDDTRLQSELTLDQGTSQTFRCEVQGTRPAVQIEWFLRDVSQRTTSTPSRGDELVNTTDTWTMNPDRTNHKQEVKCVASIPESPEPFPFVMVTLNINGPPDTPVITSNASTIENEPIRLTCRGDWGFPADWRLYWFNGDIPLPDQTTMSSPSGDRFMFTSTLDLTPTRENNGNTIRCAARKDDWTTSPSGNLGPINVQFCTRMVSITGCPHRVVSGGTAFFSCQSESSNPASNLTWLRDDMDQTSSDQQVLTDGDYDGQVSTLDFTTVVLTRADNEAVYTCCTTGSAVCTTECDTCSLNVQYHPYFFEPNAVPTGPLEEGDDVVLSCTADGNPKPPDFIIWERVGSTDSLPSVYSNGTSTLTLSSISREQAGPYRCRGNNGVPPVVYSSQVDVAVHYEVAITNRATDNYVEVNEGENALLVCVAKGNPLPIITWLGPLGAHITNQTEPGRIFLVDTLLGGDDVYGYVLQSILHVNRVIDDEDYGYYACNSGNGIGWVDIMSIQLTSKTIPTPGEVDLTTLPPPLVRSTTTIPGYVDLSTTLPTRSISTSALPVEVESTFVLLAKPSPPEHVLVDQTRRVSDTITITWTPGNDGGRTQWFHVNYRMVLTTTAFDPRSRSDRLYGVNEYTLVGLRPYTVYEIEVYAENEIGVSEAVRKIATTLQSPTQGIPCVSCSEKTTALPTGILASTATVVDKTTGPLLKVDSATALPAVAEPKGYSALLALVVILAIVALISIILAAVLYRKRRSANVQRGIPNPTKKQQGKDNYSGEEGSVVTEIVEFQDLDMQKTDDDVTSSA